MGLAEGQGKEDEGEQKLTGSSYGREDVTRTARSCVLVE